MTNIFLDRHHFPSSTERDHAIEKINQMDDRQVLEYVYHLYPDWIVRRLQHYALEYAVLENNWVQLCQRWNTTPQEILVVTFLPDQSNILSYQILMTFSNRLTKLGFVVRKESDLTACSVCKHALLSKEAFDFLKQRKSQFLPEKWTQVCQACQSIA